MAIGTPPGGERRMTAWIGRSVIVRGDVISSEDLTIDGQVEGTIEVGNHSLTIGQTAAVKANLVAKHIAISGAVTGNVTATERVELLATGSIAGDLNAPKLAMTEGAVLEGKVNVP